MNYFSKNILIIGIAAISASFISVALVGLLRFSEEEVKMPSVLSASITPVRLPSTGSSVFANASGNPDYVPIRNWSIAEPEIDARSAFVIIPSKDKALFRKNIDEQLPIASITKLMTAVVLLEESESRDLNDVASLLDEEVMVKYSHVMTEGESGNLVVGESLSLGDLLKAMIISSSNDATEVIAETVGNKLKNSRNLVKSPRTSFIDEMNKQAEVWGLSSTNFSNPTGLIDQDNFSTARDLAQLVNKIMSEYPLIWDISKVESIDVWDSTGWIKHHLTNTNELLGVSKNIIGSKTGYTEVAGECIIVIQKSPVISSGVQNSENIVYIVLGSDNRFRDVKILMDWVDEAFLW